MAENMTKATSASVRSGEMRLAGFAIRGREFVVYVVTEGEDQEKLLSRIGRHRMGKACLYFKRQADLDQTVLEQLIMNSVADAKRRYGGD